MNGLTQASNTKSSSSFLGEFNFNNFYAPQNSSAEIILETVKACLSCLENNYQNLSATKEEFQNYVKFHWDLSERLFGHNEKIAKKIQKICQKLISQGAVCKLIDKELTIKFRDSHEYVKLNSYHSTFLFLVSPMIKDAFNSECKEVHSNILSLNMSKGMFLKIFEMAKKPEINDSESINNILEVYENVNLLRIDQVRRGIVQCILSNIKHIDFEGIISIYNYFSTHLTDDSKQICEALFINIGEHYIEQSQWKEAHALVNSAIQAHFEPSQINYLKSCLKTIQKDYISALGDISSALDQYSKDSRYFIQRAYINFMLSDYTEALKDLDYILAQEPSNSRALTERGNVYRVLGYLQIALIDYDRVVLNEPNYALALRGRGEVYRRLGKHVEALHDLDKALKININDVFALTRRADVYHQQDKFNEALTDFDTALKIEPKSVVALSGRGDVYRQQGQFMSALQDLNAALEIEPNNTFALRARGDIYRAQGKCEEALKEFDKALKINPKDTLTLRARSEVHLQNDNVSLALKDFFKAAWF